MTSLVIGEMTSYNQNEIPLAMDRRFVFPPNSYIWEALIPSVMLFGGKTFERLLGHESRAVIVRFMP